MPVAADERVPTVKSAEHLTLDEILPPAVLPPAMAAAPSTLPAPSTVPASRAATAPSTRPAPDRPPLEALRLYAEACDNLAKHRRLAAITLLEKAIELDPHSFELHYALGRAHMSSAAMDERALPALTRAAQLNPDRVELQTDLGRQYLARGEADKALWHLRLALKTSDYATDEAEAAVAELFAGRALARAGYHTAAIEVYERLLRRLQSPGLALRGDPEVAFLIARPELLRLQTAESYERTGRFDQALRAYDAAAARDPDDLGLRARAVRVLLAIGRFEEAIARAADAVARSGADPAALELLREACRAAGREGAVVDELRRLRARRPRDEAVLFALADVLRGQGRAPEALRLLRPAAGAAPSRAAPALRRMYECAAQIDNTGVAAARLLIDWSARHPDAVHLLAESWDDLLRPSRQPRVRLSTLEELDPGTMPGDASNRSRLEAARWFWVAQAARLRHRQDIARRALRRSLDTGVVFAPAYRAAAGVTGFEANGETSAASAAAEVARDAEALARKAAAGGDAALAAELRGLSLLGRKRYDAARLRFAEAAKAGGSSPDLLFARAIAARGAGDVSEFEGLLWKLASDFPQYESGYDALHNACTARGDEGAAARVLAAWLAADRSSVAARLAQARDAFRSGRASGGERVLDALLAERGADPRVLALARAVYTQTRRLDVFLSKLEQRHNAAPAEVTVAAQLADLLVERRRLADASRVLDATRAAVGDDADTLYQVSHLYHGVEQKGMAEKVLREVLRLDPSHPGAANDLGYALAEDGRDLDQAEELVRRGVEGEPSNPSFLDSLGWVLYKRGRFDEARQSLLRAVELSAARGAEADPVVLDHLGDALYRAGDAAGAAQRWHQAARGLALAPDSSSRDDSKSLRLQLERKTKQLDAGHPVTVAPVAPQDQTPNPIGAGN